VNRLWQWAAPAATLGIELAALLVATILFGIFLVVVGAAPGAVFGDMYTGAFGSAFAAQDSLTRAAPLMLTALCTALPARLGMVVIGNEGALLLGGLAAAAAAMGLPQGVSPGVALPVLLLSGAIAGGLWIAFSGFLRERRGVNETISSLLLFYIGLAIFLYLVEGPLRDPSSLNKPSTFPVGDANMLGNVPGMSVHLGLMFGLIACVVAYVLMEHSTFGFAARVTGGNLRAARVMGLPVTRLVLVTCALGGAGAGLAGAVEVTAIHGSANATLYAGLGFAGILVSFVARHHALAIIPVAILMGGIEASGGILQRRHDLPDAAVDVFKGILFLVILASETYVGKAVEAVQRAAAKHATEGAASAAAAHAPVIEEKSEAST
jgi:ABC-type uncharacterized transport system permease subunit